jgi:hypothetical protein
MTTKRPTNKEEHTMTQAWKQREERRRLELEKFSKLSLEEMEEALRKGNREIIKEEREREEKTGRKPRTYADIKECPSVARKPKKNLRQTNLVAHLP